MNKIFVLCLILATSIVWANQRLEQFGETSFTDQSNININNQPKNIARYGPVLLIPDWTTDSIFMFGADDARALGGLCKVPGSGSPKNAIQGPDNNIYVSDQVQDAVFMFDTLGTYLGIYADASDGLDNVRGIAFRGDHLFVCCYPTTLTRAVKEFSGPHTFVRDFITYTNVDPFDIHFLPDGRSLFADAGTSDKIALHDTNGAYISTVYGRAGLWPQQVQIDSVLPGGFLGALWDADTIIDFDLAGTVFHTCTLKYVKGVYRLGNGNIMATSNYGIWVFDTLTGDVNRINTGTGYQYIELFSMRSSSISELDNIRSFAGTVNIYPNPFSARTRINYSINRVTPVIIAVYNCLGNEIRVLTDQIHSAGNYSATWDGKDNHDKSVANGIYMLVIKTDGEFQHSELILIK